jgi:hypothetical protein
VAGNAFLSGLARVRRHRVRRAAGRRQSSNASAVPLGNPDLLRRCMKTPVCSWCDEDAFRPDDIRRHVEHCLTPGCPSLETRSVRSMTWIKAEEIVATKKLRTDEMEQFLSADCQKSEMMRNCDCTARRTRNVKSSARAR